MARRFDVSRTSLSLSLDNDVLETSKRRAMFYNMFYNILSQNFIVKCFTQSYSNIPKLSNFYKRDICLVLITQCPKFFLTEGCQKGFDVIHSQRHDDVTGAGTLTSWISMALQM